MRGWKYETFKIFKKYVYEAPSSPLKACFMGKWTIDTSLFVFVGNCIYGDERIGQMIITHVGTIPAWVFHMLA